jgi:hypothetical protein
MAQVYTNDIHFTKIIPMKKTSEAPDSLIHFMQDVGCEDNLDPQLDQCNEEVIRVALLTFDLKR